MAASTRQLELTLLPDRFAVSRLAADAPIPGWATQGAFFSVTRTCDELSVVCELSRVPVGVQSQSGWRAFRARRTAGRSRDQFIRSFHLRYRLPARRFRSSVGRRRCSRARRTRRKQERNRMIGKPLRNSNHRRRPAAFFALAVLPAIFVAILQARAD